MIPWHARLILIQPGRILASIDRIRAHGGSTPTLWQVELIVLRMVHRLLFRPDTVGRCTTAPRRAGWRAWLLDWRPLRLPFLLWERALTPWDLSGLASSRPQIIRHLLCAHHDRDDFQYDLELLTLHPGGLEELRERLLLVVDQPTSRAQWLQDLVVFEDYHRRLLAGTERFLAGERSLDPLLADDPDVALAAVLRWGTRQPASPAQTWAAWPARRFHPQHGVPS
jgi:hypothetical protein